MKIHYEFAATSDFAVMDAPMWGSHVKAQIAEVERDEVRPDAQCTR